MFYEPLLGAGRKIGMRKLNNTEKIKIYIPERTNAVIRSDAEQFEIFKSNGEEIN